MKLPLIDMILWTITVTIGVFTSIFTILLLFGSAIEEFYVWKKRKSKK